MEESASEKQAFENALNGLRDAYESAAQAAYSMSTGGRAFRCATDLADALREIAEEAADLRARTVARIAEEEKLSLAVLADRIGVSKARAGKLMQNAKKITGKVINETEDQPHA